MQRRFIAVCLALLLLPFWARGADSRVSRGQFVLWLWQWAGSVPFAVDQSFDDVDRNSCWAEAIAWAKDAGLVIGDGAGRFYPDAPLTYEHLELILARYDILWNRPGGLYLPGACQEDFVSWADGQKAVEQFYSDGATEALFLQCSALATATQ